MIHYHPTTEGPKLKLLGEIRTGHVMLMTNEMWKKDSDKHG